MHRIFAITPEEAERIVSHSWADRFFTTYGLVDGQSLDQYTNHLYSQYSRRWEPVRQALLWLGLGSLAFGIATRAEFVLVGLGLVLISMLVGQATGPRSAFADRIGHEVDATILEQMRSGRLRLAGWVEKDDDLHELLILLGRIPAPRCLQPVAVS